MKKTNFYLILLFLLFSTVLNAQYEFINQGFIAIWEGGAEDVFYSESEFNGHNFGSLGPSSSLYLKSGQLIVSKDAEGDIVACNMYYRLYKVGETPGTFNDVILPWHSEWDEEELLFQMWWNDPPEETDLNLLEGLSDGNYIIEVYFQAENGDSEILYLNNATLNYVATFTFSSTTDIAKPRDANQNSFDVYPNPATNQLSIKFLNQTKVKNLKIINCKSEVIFDGGKIRGANDFPINLPIEQLDSGLYFIHVETEHGVEIQRVIIRK